MAKQSKIERYNLVGIVLELAAQGKSTHEIADIITKQHGVPITHAAVARFLKQVRKERAEVTRSIVEEHIQKSLPSDLQILDEMNAELWSWFKDKNLKKGFRLHIYDRLLKGIQLKLEFSGAKEDIDVVQKTLAMIIAAAERREKYEHEEGDKGT